MKQNWGGCYTVKTEKSQNWMHIIRQDMKDIDTTSEEAK